MKMEKPRCNFEFYFFFKKKKVVHHFIYNPETAVAACRNAEAASFPFPGIFLWENFISEEEEEELVCSMDGDAWNQSQSGRRKQVPSNKA